MVFSNLCYLKRKMRNSGKQSENGYFNAGTYFTSESFLLDNLLFYRKKKEEFFSVPIGDWKNAPCNTKSICSSTFHIYDIHTQKCTEIGGIQFYTALRIFRENGGISKIDEEYMYGKAIDNNFILHCLFTSEYM
jgi:hypothetical protein